MKFENTEVWGFEHAIRGMRNPLESWNKSDSFELKFSEKDFNEAKECRLINDICEYEQQNLQTDNLFIFNNAYVIGKNDLKLMQNLIRAGSPDRKFLRQIFVSVDITAPLFWWKEFDTYKVGTVRNSCSTMHKIHVKEFIADDFTHNGIDEFDFTKDTFNIVLNTLERCRIKFNETKDKRYWRAIIELLPDGYEMMATLTMDYENIFSMCSKGQRRFHKLNEWSGKDNPDLLNFISWARSLPYAQELIFLDEL